MNAKIIGTQIQKLIQGQALWSKQSRDLYSVDASPYYVMPLVVVIPENEQDIINVLKYASKNYISVTVRGAGTGLVGSALGKGIILDLKKFDKIRIGKNYVEAGSGVYKGRLDSEIEKRGKFFAPNPSIGPYCTIGGMIGTNASGSHSLKYGSTIDNLLGVRVITSDGKIYQFPSNSTFTNKIFNLLNSKLQKKFPAVSKNSCGYRLDKIRKKSDLQKIFAGSEGTLGIVVSAKLKTRLIPKKQLLAILAYKTTREAVADAIKICKIKPSALEIIDHNIIKHINTKLSKNMQCALFVEFDTKINESKRRMENIIPHSHFVMTVIDNNKIKKWWHLRNSALSYSLRSISANQSMPTIIEDATVPVERLVLLVDIIEKIAKKYKIKYVLYGHAGNGNLHIRPILENKNKSLIKKIAKEFFLQVIRIGGSITGEHGDGYARSEFVKLQYSSQVYNVFKKIKKEFDPKNILNPDKILVTKSSIVKNLKI